MSFAARIIRDNQLRAIEVGGAPVPRFTIWDPHEPDARVKDVKKRGLIRTKWGPGSAMYCDHCHRKSPYAVSESMLKVKYRCLRCIASVGSPVGATMVPGTGHM